MVPELRRSLIAILNAEVFHSSLSSVIGTLDEMLPIKDTAGTFLRSVFRPRMWGFLCRRAFGTEVASPCRRIPPFKTIRPVGLKLESAQAGRDLPLLCAALPTFWFAGADLQALC